MGKALFQRLALSVTVSLLVLGLVLGLVARSHPGVSPGALLAALRNATAGLVAVYVALQVGQATLRAQRARVLLRAGSQDGTAPGITHLFWVTVSRNMFVDMLPGRLGELSYVAMLNRGYRLGADVCLSSLSVGLVFDFLALLVVLAVALPSAAQGASLLGSLAMLAAICAIGYAGLFHLLPWGTRWVRRAWPRGLVAWKPFAALLRLAEEVVESLLRVRAAGILGRVLALSAGIRVCKYVGLYLLFLAVVRPMWPVLGDASPWAVLVALIAAEGAASLPVPTFMSFGTYQAGGLAALRALGFAAGDSVMAMFALHVLSQLVDYSMGIVAYGVFSWRAPAVAAPGRGMGRRRLVRSALAALLVVVGAGFAAYQWRAFRRLGALAAPDHGNETAFTPEETAVRATTLATFRGRVVWSSNRAGQHDLWMLTFPGERLTRLTEDPHTETYPRFSPDGRRVVFCRSHEPWVSQRNPGPWDAHVLDLETRVGRRVAVGAFTPVWSPDGNAIVFVRDGSAVVRQRLDADTTDVLASARPGTALEGVVFQTPDIAPDGTLALTLRGRRRATVLLDSAGVSVPVGGGCQLVWLPGFRELVYVDREGRQANAFLRFDRRDGTQTVLLDVANAFGHRYFPRVSADGLWMVYGASSGGHEHDTADYEIFLWRVGSPPESATRLTAHSGNDGWPDVWSDPAP